MTTQLQIPIDIPVSEIARKKNLGDAITLCIDAGGFDLDKQAAAELKIDKAQISRWQSEIEGIKWKRLANLMDSCGNNAPLLWMNYQRGYDLHSLRERETETQRENRLLREENAALRRVLVGGGQ